MSAQRRCGFAPYMRRGPAQASRSTRAQRGFTLIELLIALTLMALMTAVLFGSLNLASKSWDSGDAKAEATANMRLAEQFLRSQLEEQHPQRMKRIVEFPLLFSGAADEMQYAAALPARVQGGGVWLYRLHVVQDGDKSALVLDRMVPDIAAATMPEFSSPDHSVLAEGIKDVKLQYFGRDDGADVSVEPTWRDRWDSHQSLPLTIRIDVTPLRGAAWPTIFASPRNAPESGCRGYDFTRQRCVSA
jgi:general secretion pathway protein J